MEEIVGTSSCLGEENSASRRHPCPTEKEGCMMLCTAHLCQGVHGLDVVKSLLGDGNCKSSTR